MKLGFDPNAYRFRLLLLALVALVVAHSLASSGTGGRALGPLGVIAMAGMLFALSRARWVFCSSRWTR